MQVGLRVVKRKGEKNDDDHKGFIQILKREITLNQSLINLFVLCKVDLLKKEMTIFTEDERGNLHTEKKLNFKLKNIEY